MHWHFGICILCHTGAKKVVNVNELAAGMDEHRTQVFYLDTGQDTRESEWRPKTTGDALDSDQTVGWMDVDVIDGAQWQTLRTFLWQFRKLVTDNLQVQVLFKMKCQASLE